MDHLAILLGPLNLCGHRGFGILRGVTPTLLILGECLLLGLMPGLVETALDFL